MKSNPENPLFFSNRAAWRAWLEEHYTTEQEAWLLHYKKKAPQQALTYEQAVEEALCFGWIDGLLKTIDNEKFALRYSPRQPRSVWSIANQERVETLIREGKMTEAGLVKVNQARQNGEWQAAIDREVVDDLPGELVEKLKENQAWEPFMKIPSSHRKQYLYWLESAKRPETREKRLLAIVKMVKDKMES